MKTRKFSCADFTFPLLPHDKVLDLLQLLDFKAVDLGIFEDRSHHFPSVIAKDPAKNAEDLKKKLRQRDLEVADVFVQTGAEPPVAAVNDPDPAVRERNAQTLAGMIEFTSQIGAKHLTGLPGVFHQGVAGESDWELAVSETQRRVEACRKNGIIYAIEPHIGSILTDPPATLRFLKAVPGLTLTLDYGHFIYQGMANEKVHPLIEHTSHFHARGGADGALQASASENTIDFAEIMRRLDVAGYNGYLCLEYVWVNWAGCNRTDNISETLLLRKALKSAN